MLYETIQSDALSVRGAIADVAVSGGGKGEPISLY